MRSVAQEANANLAAANYHFGSKDALVLEMLRERIQPINARRMELLNRQNRIILKPNLAHLPFFTVNPSHREEISKV